MSSLLILTLFVLKLVVFACTQEDLRNPLARENRRNDLARIEELIVQLLKVKDRLTPSVEYDKQWPARFPLIFSAYEFIVGGCRPSGYLMAVDIGGCYSGFKTTESDDVEYDNEWAVEVIGEEEEAKKIAKTFGYIYVGRIRGFDNTYVFRKDGHRHKRAADDLTGVLRSNYRVRRTAFLSESKRPQAPN